ncbi:hypothetical protein B566_EDAN012903, partial [Ephemera danica]
MGNKAIKMYLFTILLLELLSTCFTLENDANIRDYNVFLGSRPLTSFSVYSPPAISLETNKVVNSIDRQSVPTMFSTDSVDVYVFPSSVTKDMFWKTKEAKILHDDAVVNITYYTDFVLEPDHL